MNTNIPALATVYADLESVLAKLTAIDADKIESANLVPMVKAVQAIGAYASARRLSRSRRSSRKPARKSSINGESVGPACSRTHAGRAPRVYAK